MSDETEPRPLSADAADSTERQRWLHELRNEVSTMAIGAASARRLLDTDRARALENLRRVEDACLRCAELLRAAP